MVSKEVRYYLGIELCQMLIQILDVIMENLDQEFVSFLVIYEYLVH
jgi:hypothetical protein